jgi:outer membrane protein TolC
MKLFFAISILLSAFLSNAQPLKLVDIKDRIRDAHPALKMFDADIRAMDEASNGAKSWMPPEVGAGFWMTPYNPKMWQPGMKNIDGEQAPGMGSIMLSAQQMFPNRGRQSAEQEYMRAMSSVEKERKNTSLNELVAQVKKNYYDWMIGLKKLAILEQDEKLLNFMIKNAEIRYRNGMEKLSAYYKAKAALGNLQNMKLMLEAGITQNRINLNGLMNRNKELTFQIDTTYTINEFTTAFDSTSFITARSDIKAIEKNIQLVLLQQNLEKQKLKPEFGIKYDHMFAWAQQPWQFSLMGMAKIPISRSTRMQKANIESLKWKVESYKQEREMVINEATAMGYNMLTDIQTKKKQIQLYENNIIPALANNYKTMQLGYEQNTEELFMLFDAWETLYMTQLNYLDQLKELLLMQAELERILEIK